MDLLQETDSDKKQIAHLGYTIGGAKIYINVAMREPQYMNQFKTESEAEILLGFFKFLKNKPADLVFNVPRGKVDRIDKSKLKFFLDLKGINRQKVWEPLEERGWQALPFFIIDPYDRSNYPSLSTDLRENSSTLFDFMEKIEKSIWLIEKGISPLI